MKKFFKSLLWIGGAAVAAHFGIKAYKRVSGTAKLSQSLPEFLSNVYGELPLLNVNASLGQLNISARFSEEIIEKHDDIENTIREYVADFYPELAKFAINVDILALDDENEEPEMDEDEDEE